MNKKSCLFSCKLPIKKICGPNCTPPPLSFGFCLQWQKHSMKGSGGLRQLLVWMSCKKDMKTKDCRRTGQSRCETHPVVMIKLWDLLSRNHAYRQGCTCRCKINPRWKHTNTYTTHSGSALCYFWRWGRKWSDLASVHMCTSLSSGSLYIWASIGSGTCLVWWPTFLYIWTW